MPSIRNVKSRVDGSNIFSVQSYSSSLDNLYRYIQRNGYDVLVNDECSPFVYMRYIQFLHNSFLSALTRT